MSFIRISNKDTIVSNEEIVKPAWLNDTETLSAQYIKTSPDSDYYLQVYAQSPSTSPDTPVQFSIAYGHKTGASSTITLSDGTGSTKQIYNQYKSVVYNTEDGDFFFGDLITSTGYTSIDFYVISIARASYRQKIKAGSVNLRLKNGNDILNLTDYSYGQSTSNYIGGNRFYHLVKGTNGIIDSASSISNTTAGSYGFILPDKGLIFLNPNALKLSVGNKGIGLSLITTGLTRLNNNNIALFNLMKFGTFGLRGSETVATKIIQATVNMDECNYTTNPTFIDPNGVVNFPESIDNPEPYITTIGLYNDQLELIAIAKLSKPLKKNFTLKPTIEIRLNW